MERGWRGDGEGMERNGEGTERGWRGDGDGGEMERRTKRYTWPHSEEQWLTLAPPPPPRHLFGPITPLCTRPLNRYVNFYFFFLLVLSSFSFLFFFCLPEVLRPFWAPLWDLETHPRIFAGCQLSSPAVLHSTSSPTTKVSLKCSWTWSTKSPSVEVPNKHVRLLSPLFFSFSPASGLLSFSPSSLPLSPSSPHT